MSWHNLCGAGRYQAASRTLRAVMEGEAKKARCFTPLIRMLWRRAGWTRLRRYHSYGREQHHLEVFSRALEKREISRLG